MITLGDYCLFGLFFILIILLIAQCTAEQLISSIQTTPSTIFSDVLDMISPFSSEAFSFPGKLLVSPFSGETKQVFYNYVI